MIVTPTLHSHTITHNLIVFNGVRECFAFAKSHQPTHNPKLGKECVCPTARPKRPTNQRTKKNTEAITSPIRKQGFSFADFQFVLRRKFSGKNPCLRIAENRPR